MVDMKSTQAFLYFECNTQIVVFILNELHCSSSPRRRYFFILDKEYISVNTKSKNTEKTTMCSSWSKRLRLYKFTFLGKNFNFHVDTKT